MLSAGRRGVLVPDSPESMFRFDGGAGSVPRRRPRRGVAPDFVSAGRLRGSRTTTASEGGFDLVAV